MDVPTPRQLLSTLISSIPSPPSHQQQPPNPLLQSPPAVQRALLTLHVLFPNELLNALDLLDRGLVTRLTIAPPQSEEETPSATAAAQVTGDLEFPVQVETEEAAGTAQDRGETTRTIADELREHTHPVQRRQHADSPFRRQHRHHDERYACLFHVRRAGTVPRGSVHRGAAAGGREGGSEVRLAAWSCSCPAFAFAAFPGGEAAISDGDDFYASRLWHDGSENWRFGGLSLGGETRVCKHLLACALAEHCALFAGSVEHREVSLEELAGWAAGWGD